MKPTAHLGDCVEVLATMEPEMFDSVVCDPPYHLTAGKKGGSGEASVNPRSPAGRSMVTTGFMGKQWDGGDVAFRPETWAAIARVMKPGAYLVAFGGTRTSHRMACAIEDAGFEIRDSLLWLYGTGFPKSLDVSKAIDKAAGAEREVVGFDERKAVQQTPKRGTSAFGDYGGDVSSITAPATEAARQWQGWGTALKPAHENIILARKPLAERTVAANVLAHGVGALNVDGCRVPSDRKPQAYTVRRLKPGATLNKTGGNWRPEDGPEFSGETPSGRWPSNVLHDGSPEVLEAFARFGEKKTPATYKRNVVGQSHPGHMSRGAGKLDTRETVTGFGDTGTAARFFPELGFHYSGKATKADRAGSKHPTIKPQSLMRWLCRLVTPPGGHVLDPFAGSGSTLQAAHREGFRATGIELTPEHFEDIQRRLRLLEAFDDGLFAGMEECA